MQVVLKSFLLISILSVLISCSANKNSVSSAPLVGMFKVEILYPNGEGKTFDMDYYEKKHMPMVAGFIGNNLRFYEIDKGVAGRTPTDPIPYLAAGYFYVKDVAEYAKAMAKNRDAVVADFKNYTNIQPVVHITEIRQVVRNNVKRGNTE